MEAALFKSTKQWDEKEWAPARSVLLLTMLESGEDLVVSAGSEVFELASELQANTPVGINVVIEQTRYHGSLARLRATRLEVEIDNDRLVATDTDYDDSAKAARRKLNSYGKRISQ